MKQTQSEPAERGKRRRWPPVVSVVACVALMVGGLAYYGLTRPLTHAQRTEPFRIKWLQPKAAPNPERTNILLIGTDTRPGEPGGNSDVLIFCSLDQLNKRIELLSIPRDTRVKFPDGHYAKINEGLQVGGPALTGMLVENLLNQPIDHYALTHFGGLVDIINTIGGVTVNVPERMYYNTGDQQYSVINLHKGVQTLNGEQALGFVRFRHDALGDIGRTERQQLFLVALGHQLLQPSNLTKLPTLVRQFWDTMETDMNMLNVMSLASHASQFKDYPMVHETLPGSFHDPNPGIPNDVSYWIVNPVQAKYAAETLLEDGLVQKNPIQDPSVTYNWTPPSPLPANVTGNVSSAGKQ